MIPFKQSLNGNYYPYNKVIALILLNPELTCREISANLSDLPQEISTSPTITSFTRLSFCDMCNLCRQNIEPDLDDCSCNPFFEKVMIKDKEIWLWNRNEKVKEYVERRYKPATTQQIIFEMML